MKNRPVEGPVWAINKPQKGGSQRMSRSGFKCSNNIVTGVNPKTVKKGCYNGVGDSMLAYCQRLGRN